MADLLSPQEIAEALRELQRTSPRDRSELAAWDASARAFWNAVSIPLPSGVMHYLHDADTRIKDPAYRDYQNEMINQIISDLESGAIPPSNSVTISFRSRWIGAIALVVIALILVAITR